MNGHFQLKGFAPPCFYTPQLFPNDAGFGEKHVGSLGLAGKKKSKHQNKNANKKNPKAPPGITLRS